MNIWKPSKKPLPWELIYTVAAIVIFIYQIARFFYQANPPA